MVPTKEHFAAAAAEVARDQIEAGLWAMATAESLGNKDSTYAIYLKLRAEELSKEGRSTAAIRIYDAIKNSYDRTLEYLFDLVPVWFYFYAASVVFILVVSVLIEMYWEKDLGKSLSKLLIENLMVFAGASVVAAVIYKFYKKRT